MGVSHSGYYKWKKRDRSEPNLKREQMIELVRDTHEKHRTHGYKWTAAFICINTEYTISHNFAYKCFKYLGISAETEHKVHYKPRKVKDRYPNLIFSTWETVDRPRQVIVSDMTAFKLRLLYAEVTFYFDVFTKEMLTFRVAERRCDRMQYIDGLEDVRKLLWFTITSSALASHWDIILQLVTADFFWLVRLNARTLLTNVPWTLFLSSSENAKRN